MTKFSKDQARLDNVTGRIQKMHKKEADEFLYTFMAMQLQVEARPMGLCVLRAAAFGCQMESTLQVYKPFLKRVCDLTRLELWQRLEKLASREGHTPCSDNVFAKQHLPSCLA